MTQHWEEITSYNYPLNIDEALFLIAKERLRIERERDRTVGKILRKLRVPDTGSAVVHKKIEVLRQKLCG